MTKLFSRLCGNDNTIMSMSADSSALKHSLSQSQQSHVPKEKVLIDMRTDLEGVDVDNDVEDDPDVANSGSEDQLQLRQASSSDMKDFVLNDALETTDWA